MALVLQAIRLWLLPGALLWLLLLPGILIAVGRCRDTAEVTEAPHVRMAVAVAMSLCLCYALLILRDLAPGPARAAHAAFLVAPTLVLLARKRLRGKVLRFVLLCSDVQVPLLMMAGLTTFQLGQPVAALAGGDKPLQLAVRFALAPAASAVVTDTLLQTLWIPAVWLVLRLLGAGRRHAVTAVVSTGCAALVTNLGLLESPAVTAGASWLVAVAALLWLPDSRSRLFLAATGFAFAMLSHGASAYAIVALLVMVPLFGTRLTLGDWCRTSGLAFAVYLPWMLLHGTAPLAAAGLVAATALAGLGAWPLLKRVRADELQRHLPEALALAVTALVLSFGVRLALGEDAPVGGPAGAYLLLVLVGSAAAAKLPRPFWLALLGAQALILLAITAHAAQGPLAWLTLPGAASLALSPWAGIGGREGSA